MVKFTALQSAKVLDFNAPNRHDDGLEKEIIRMVLENPKITMAEIAEKE